jgi:hypothetical protein
MIILISTAHNCLLIFMRSKIAGLMLLVYCYDINPLHIHRNQKDECTVIPLVSLYRTRVLLLVFKLLLYDVL